MTRVLIIAKTKMQTGVCIGGLNLDTQCMVRLLPEYGHNHCNETPYEVGQVWQMALEPIENPVPPHAEDVRVLQCEQVGRQEGLASTLFRCSRPWFGGPQNLFDGLIQATMNGSGYVSNRHGVPNRSTGFWVADRQLVRVDNGEKVRYEYPADEGVRFISFVGFQQPLPKLNSGTLLRVSLARWWRPEEKPDMEERCYLQLSGWYLR